MRLPILHTEARSILSSTSGFIAQAGFTYSLSPARNCTYGCTYCYVPTMGVYGGLQPLDWQRWGQFTTFKQNAPALLARSVRPHMVIYCSPLVDPYQPAEETEFAMPAILDQLIDAPPRVFVIQTRGPLIMRDARRLQQLSERCRLRVSFSLTTDDDRVRRCFEPRCPTLDERLAAIRALRHHGIEVTAALAPILPCDPERFAAAAIEATAADLIGDPLHVRGTKRHGATTREAAWRIGAAREYTHWFEPAFQQEIVERIRITAAAAGHRFAIGPEGFSWLAKN